jgi:hypothetical protein
MQRLSQIRKRRQDGAILCDQRHRRLLGCGNKLTVESTAVTGAHQLQHAL